MAEGGNNNGQVVDQIVDIDKLALSLARILDDVPQYMCRPGHPGRISKIPEILREIDAKAYEPKFVSIGPYHHDKHSVQPMEKSKWLALKYVREFRKDFTLKDYLNELKALEATARSFYSDIQMESEKFVEMLLLDSLYIITTFCGVPSSQEKTNHVHTENENILDDVDIGEREKLINRELVTRVDNDNSQTNAGADEKDENVGGGNAMTRLFSSLFEHDLFLLENQIPFFVLEKVFALTYGGSATQLIDIMKDRVSILLSGYTVLDSEMFISPTEEVHHLLHLCHLFFRPTLQHKFSTCQLSQSSEMFRLGSVVQLFEAGVNFEARSSSAQHSLLDITFGSSGKMIMPCLHVDDNTGSLLRNLIALEQMKYPHMGLDVSAYAVLWLHLITTPEDVKLLRRYGIIQHHLASDKEMMYLINRLSVGLSFDYVEDEYSLKHVFQELKNYTERRRPRWKAWLKHRYFENPWTAISFLAASFLLLLSVVQTYITVCSYYQSCFHGHL